MKDLLFALLAIFGIGLTLATVAILTAMALHYLDEKDLL